MIAPMDRAAFILEAQGQGWLLFSSNREGLTFQCAHSTCGAAVFVSESEIHAGRVPRPCDGPHSEGRRGYVIAGYPDFILAVKELRKRFGLAIPDVEGAGGLADGHLNKIENGDRLATMPTFLAIAATLGLRLVLEPEPLHRRTTSAIDYRNRRPMKKRWRKIPARRLGDDDDAGPWAAE